MNRCVAIILACCLLEGCGTTSPTPPKADASNKYRIDTALSLYLDCAFDYGNRYAQSNASASEIADAAVATCETHLQDYQRIMTASMIQNYTTQHGIQVAREGVKEHIRESRSATRGTVISKVLEIRKSGHAPGRAPASPLSDISAADLQTLQTQAAQGDAKAQANLGALYHQSRGVPQDYVKARQWYEKAAAQGNAQAQYALGVLYGNGQGMPQDYAQAHQWYEKAATQGHASAQYNLGALYDGGAGVPQSDTMARQWYEKASAQGDAEAQFVLGTLYATGQGVSQDYVRAYMLVTLAAARLTGDEQKFAADSRDKLASIMTPAQIVEAQRLTQQCRSQNFKGC